MAAEKWQKHLSLSCAVAMKNYYSRAPTIEINNSSSASGVELAKTKAISHLLTYA